MGNKLKILCWSLCLSSQVVWSTEVAPLPGGQLPGAEIQGLLELARQQNPELAAMRLEADAAAERVNSAGALPDPMFKTELRDISNRGDSNPSLLPNRVGSTYYQVTQTLPFWGKRDLKRDIASAEADQARGRIGTSWAELSARIKTVFAQYYLLVHSEKLTWEILELAANLERIAQSRYATGLAAQQDVIRAQVEQSGLRRELVMIKLDHHHTMTRLNTLLLREPHAPLAEPQRLRPIPTPDKLNYTALEERLRANNPQLFTLDAQVAAAEKSRDLVFKNRYPDFTLGVAPIQTGNRINEWELMLELNIPLQQSSRRSQEREAVTMLAAAQARRTATANQVLSDLAESLLALDAAREIEALNTSSLLPQAETTFQSALGGYETGKVDFATLLDAQRQILKAKLDVLNAQAEAQVRLAEIEKLLGEEL